MNSRFLDDFIFKEELVVKRWWWFVSFVMLRYEFAEYNTESSFCYLNLEINAAFAAANSHSQYQRRIFHFGVY